MRAIWLILAIGGLAAGATRVSRLPAANANAVIHLRDFADISGVSIHLSDLFPQGLFNADPSNSVLVEASHITLGTSPLPGSLRTFTSAQLLKLVQGQAWPYPLAIPEQVTVRRRVNPADYGAIRVAVAHFLATQGWGSKQINEAVIESNTNVAGEPDNPQLSLIAGVWDAAQQSFQIRLRCLNTTLCKPFLVEVRPTHSQTTSGPARINLVSAMTLRKPSATSAIVKAGSKAMLIVEGPGMRITLPVICLQSGMVKARIQVRDVLHHRTLQAEVEGVGRLREIEQP